MRAGIALGITVAIVCSGTLLGAEGRPPTTQAARQIPEVKSLLELRRTKPIKLKTGWEVRLGLAGPGRVDGPWKIIYCLASFPGPRPPEVRLDNKSPGKPLGPVFFWLEREADGREIIPLRPWGRIRPPGGELLYCGGVPLAWKGRFNLKVLSPTGELVSRRTFAVDRPAACHWRLFAESADENAQTFIASSRNVAAMPSYSGLWPVRSRSGPRPQVKRLRHADGTEELLPEDQLPTELLWPRGARGKVYRLAQREGRQKDYPLRLSLDKGTFVVRSDVKMNDDVERHFLARWWVNDKPRPVPLATFMRGIRRGRAVVHRNELRVTFGLPESMKRLKGDETVGLQVAYCPTGWQVIPKVTAGLLGNASGRPEHVFVPLLSNRLDFKLTRDLLSQAQHARQKRMSAAVAVSQFGVRHSAFDIRYSVFLEASWSD